jgi:hypothetical protein
MRATNIAPLLEAPRDAHLRGRLVGFRYLFVCCSGSAFAIAFSTGDKFDWVLGAMLLPFGVSLLWKPLRILLDRRLLVLFIVRAALFGTILGAAVSPFIRGAER